MAQSHKTDKNNKNNKADKAKVKLNKSPAKQDAKAKAKLAEKPNGKDKLNLTKKQIGIICGAVVAIIIIVAVVLIFMLNRNQPQEETTEETEVAETTQAVDYDQKVTDQDGGEFKAEYQAGSEESFAVRFSDLKCKKSCKNVSEVKLGNKTLKQGEDYEVKSGSIIIILTEKLMKSLNAGKFDLVIAVVDEDETKFYGVKFTVKPEPTCEEGKVLEKGECVEKPEEQEKSEQASNTTAKPSTSNSQVTTQPAQSSQPATPVKPQAQIDCESRAAPTGLSQVRWYSEAEKQELDYSDDIAAGISSYDIESAEMKWVNGACHPSNIRVFGMGLVPTTWDSISQNSAYMPYQAAFQNQGRNMVVWYWGGGRQNYTIEFLDDLGLIWCY